MSCSHRTDQPHNKGYGRVTRLWEILKKGSFGLIVSVTPLSLETAMVFLLTRWTTPLKEIGVSSKALSSVAVTMSFTWNSDVSICMIVLRFVINLRRYYWRPSAITIAGSSSDDSITRRASFTGRFPLTFLAFGSGFSALAFLAAFLAGFLAAFLATVIDVFSAAFSERIASRAPITFRALSML